MSSPNSTPTFSATDRAFNHTKPSSSSTSNAVGMASNNNPIRTTNGRSLVNGTSKTIKPMASIDELFSQIRQGLDRAEREKQEEREREFQKRACGRCPHAVSKLDTRSIFKRLKSELMNSEPNKEDVDESTADNRSSEDLIVANTSTETICWPPGSQRTGDEDLKQKLYAQNNESSERLDDSKLNSDDIHCLQRSNLDFSVRGNVDDLFNSNIPTRLVKTPSLKPSFLTQPCEDPLFNYIGFEVFSMPSSSNYNHARPWTEEEKEGLTRLADKWIPTSDKKRRRLL